MKAINKTKNFRSSCPISTFLELMGDKWTLVIVRELMYYGERTYKDFAGVQEKISTARLADRLSKMEEYGMITKERHASNKKVFLYNLTQRGKDLAPVLAEIILWSYQHVGELSDGAKQLAQSIQNNREAVIKQFMEGRAAIK